MAWEILLKITSACTQEGLFLSQQILEYGKLLHMLQLNSVHLFTLPHAQSFLSFSNPGAACQLLVATALQPAPLLTTARDPAMRSVQAVVPETRTYNTIINACNRSGQPDEGYKVYERMLREGAVPSATTYTALISAYGKIGKVGKQAWCSSVQGLAGEYRVHNAHRKKQQCPVPPSTHGQAGLVVAQSRIWMRDQMCMATC